MTSKRQSLEQARREGRLDRFAAEHPSKGDRKNSILSPIFPGGCMKPARARAQMHSKVAYSSAPWRVTSTRREPRPKSAQ